jgi:hypothetical protein
MAKDNEERIAEMQVDDPARDRKLNRKESNLDPSSVETFNRRADSKREKYSRDNYYESVDGHEKEKMARED